MDNEDLEKLIWQESTWALGRDSVLAAVVLWTILSFQIKMEHLRHDMQTLQHTINKYELRLIELEEKE